MVSKDYKGLCIIPIETSFLRSGTVEEMLSIDYLDSIIDFANYRNLLVKYLSTSKGIVDYTTHIETETQKVHKLYARIVAEQVYRECIENFVSEVYYMGRYDTKTAKDLIESIKGYGVRVYSPIIGCKPFIIPKVLMLYKIS